MKLRIRKSSIRARLGRLLAAAALVAGLCFPGLYLGGSRLLEGYLTSEDFLRRQDQRYLSSLEEYIQAESVTAWDGEKLTQWVYKQPALSIQVMRDGVVTYDSLFPDIDFSVYPTAGQTYEWGNYHELTFADGPATVWLYGYYFYQYDARMLVMALVLSFLVFLGIVMAGLQGTIAYIRQLSREIGVMEGGTLDIPISIQGRDELTDLAQSLDAMRDSFRRQGERERRLTQANQRMVTEMSHDLRTPLTAILLYVELLRRNGADPEKREEYLDRLEGKVEQMRTLADDLFRHALSSGEPAEGEEAEAVTLEAGLGDALSELAACLTARCFRVEADLDWEDRRVHMDCAGAARVVDNLTSNLLKYADPEIPVRLTMLEEEGFAGIRLTNGLRRSGGGTESSGVGLASAEGLMARMGGRLEHQITGEDFRVALLFRCV